MLYKAVLFDLDGTLLDTLDDLADATNRALKRMGFAPHERDAYRYMVGDGATKLVTRALPENRRDPETIQACLATFKEEYGRNWNVKTRPYDGVGRMLDMLAARGVKLAVLSNKPDEFTQQCVGELLGKWKFDVVMGASERVPHKPDPAGAKETARRLGVKPGDFLYLGDTAVDMKTAQAAGMFPVGVLWGFRQREELEEAGAKALIGRPEEVMKLLG